MKNNKLILGACALLLAGTYLHAEPTADPSESINQKGIETFFYNKGYKDGLRDGEKVGYKQAFKEAKRSIKRYSKRIKSLEASKYLSKKGKITPPRLYQKQNPDGTVQVVIEGCKIEKQLTPTEVLMLPHVDDMASSSSLRGATYSSGGDSEISNAVHLIGVDKEDYRPHFSTDAVKSTFRYFPDTQFYRKLFRASGKPFAITSNEKIKVIFTSEKEALDFCAQHGLKAGRDFI